MNKLRGSIPNSVFKLVNLGYFYLSSNNLSGVLETSNFGKLRNLTWLDFSNYIGIWTWNMGKDILYSLNLSSNLISGFEMLPWKNIQILDLHSNLSSHNKLSGEISSLICKASSMGILDLSNNNLSGMLPHCLGNFSKDFFVLNLRRNQFYGTVPQTSLKGNAIRNIDFNDNKLEGLISNTFSHWLETLPKLQVLVLCSNSFHGQIGFSKIKSPFMSLRIIDFAHNDFEGDLPKMYLKSLKVTMNVYEGNMTRKYTGEYYYQDFVMVTIKGLEIEFVKILNTFTKIYLSSNKFQGEIPKSIGNLNSPRGLNLSHNNIVGHIPVFREFQFESFQNNLTRIIPRGNQFETFGNDSYDGNSGLYGFPLSKKCIVDETLELSKEAYAEYGCGLVIGLSLECLVFLSGKSKWLTMMVK
ncbi:hypothetical protein AAG906_006014 [Vitis piasezkii]